MSATQSPEPDRLDVGAPIAFTVSMLAALAALVLGGNDVRCEFTQGGWNTLGLESLCVVLSAPSDDAQLASAMSHWSLTEPQARCAVTARYRARKRPAPWDDSERGSFESWRECVSKWPDKKALWLGLINAWDYTPLEDLVAKLPPSLAEELLQLNRGPSAALSLHVLKAQPDRLLQLLKRGGQFEIALVTLTERRMSIRSEDVEAVGRAAVGGALQRGDLHFAAALWMRLPETTRDTLLTAPIPRLLPDGREAGDQRASLALGLILAEHKVEAGRIPLEGDSLVADAVTWHLSGRRNLAPWEAAIQARIGVGLHPQTFDLAAGLSPYLHPHFAILNPGSMTKDGFDSRLEGTSYGELTRAMLRSARAKSFLRLQTAIGQPRGSEPPNPNRILETYSAFLFAHQCGVPVPVDQLLVEHVDPASWTLSPRNQKSQPQEGSVCVERITIYPNGDDQAFIEFAWGIARADRGPSGAMTIKIVARTRHY